MRLTVTSHRKSTKKGASELSLLADLLFAAKLEKERAEKKWEELRAKALATGKQQFSSKSISCELISTEPSLRYDSKKLDEYFTKNNLDTKAFKNIVAGSIRLLLKPL